MVFARTQLSLLLILCAHAQISKCDDVIAVPRETLLAWQNKGLGNIEEESIDEDTDVAGAIPGWLSGNFIRHACGAFGETTARNAELPNYITHLFDCVEIAQKFKIDNGLATFTNKWYDTVTNDVYDTYGRQMNESSVFRVGAFAKANKARVQQWSANFSDHSRVAVVPHVSWWKVGDEAIAMSEGPIGVVVDPETAEQKGYVEYLDDNFGIPRNNPAYMLTNNPAHEHTDEFGILWSTVAALHFLNQTYVESWRIVYKVGADHIRHKVGEYHYKGADLTKCGTGAYPDLDARAGYLHSFGMTDNYIILPEAAYMFDPCAFTHYDGFKPFFPQGFHWEQNGYGRLLVMRKSDGQFVADIHTRPFFVTHQLGAYEDGEMVHVDMLMYDDARIYTYYMDTDQLLNSTSYTTHIMRISINMTDATASFRDLRAPDKPQAAFEMSNINYAFYGKKYTYAYAAKNFDLIDQNAILKLNVDTGVEIEYRFESGEFVQEPQFVPRPGSHGEDDGVILAQGFDGRQGKAFMVVLDAKDMTLISHVTAKHMALFGIHNRFYPLPKGRLSTGDDINIAVSSVRLSVALLLLCAVGASVIFIAQ